MHFASPSTLDRTAVRTSQLTMAILDFQFIAVGMPEQKVEDPRPQQLPRRVAMLQPVTIRYRPLQPFFLFLSTLLVGLPACKLTSVSRDASHSRVQTLSVGSSSGESLRARFTLVGCVPGACDLRRSAH